VEFHAFLTEDKEFREKMSRLAGIVIIYVISVLSINITVSL